MFREDSSPCTRLWAWRGYGPWHPSNFQKAKVRNSARIRRMSAVDLPVNLASHSDFRSSARHPRNFNSRSKRQFAILKGRNRWTSEGIQLDSSPI